MINLNRQLELLGPIDPTVMPYDMAATAWRQHRAWNGLSPNTINLLTLPGDNEKLDKGDRVNTALSLMPAKESGVNACSFSTPGCEASCVAHNGNGSYNKVRAGRIARTLFLAENPIAFCTLYYHQLEDQVEKHGRIGHRPNAFSDIRWENVMPALFTIENVDFYDYTKWPAHLRYPPANYKLTFSYSGERPRRTYRDDQNIAVVFDTKKGQPLPAEWRGRPVVDGDITDDRYADPVGVVVGLRAKGKARRDTTGFVVSDKSA